MTGIEAKGDADHNGSTLSSCKRNSTAKLLRSEGRTRFCIQGIHGSRGAIRDAEVEKGQALEAQAQEHRELIEHLKSEQAALQEAMSNLEAQKAAFTEQASTTAATSQLCSTSTRG